MKKFIQLLLLLFLMFTLCACGQKKYSGNYVATDLVYDGQAYSFVDLYLNINEAESTMSGDLIIELLDKKTVFQIKTGYVDKNKKLNLILEYVPNYELGFSLFGFSIGGRPSTTLQLKEVQSKKTDILFELDAEQELISFIESILLPYKKESSSQIKFVKSESKNSVRDEALKSAHANLLSSLAYLPYELGISLITTLEQNDLKIKNIEKVQQLINNKKEIHIILSKLGSNYRTNFYPHNVKDHGDYFSRLLLIKSELESLKIKRNVFEEILSHDAELVNAIAPIKVSRDLHFLKTKETKMLLTNFSSKTLWKQIEELDSLLSKLLDFKEAYELIDQLNQEIVQSDINDLKNTQAYLLSKQELNQIKKSYNQFANLQLAHELFRECAHIKKLSENALYRVSALYNIKNKNFNEAFESLNQYKDDYDFFKNFAVQELESYWGINSFELLTGSENYGKIRYKLKESSAMKQFTHFFDIKMKLHFERNGKEKHCYIRPELDEKVSYCNYLYSEKYTYTGYSISKYSLKNNGVWKDIDLIVKQM